MEIELLGGFGEKGRTSVGIRCGGSRIVLDAGIKVGAACAEYYPVIGAVHDIYALFISHAHEDHIGALSWLLSRGYRGRILMTAETRAEAPATLAGYADPEHLKTFPFPEDRIELFETGQVLKCGDLTINTGRSGHVVGGTWFAVDDGRRRVVYSGDVVPDSSVFAMDAMPQCDVLILDASYGADTVPGPERAEAISAWIDEHPGGCLLPTPLSGRSLELMAVLPGQFAIHAGMRASLWRKSAPPLPCCREWPNCFARGSAKPRTGRTTIPCRHVRFWRMTEWKKPARRCEAAPTGYGCRRTRPCPAISKYGRRRAVQRRSAIPAALLSSRNWANLSHPCAWSAAPASA